MKIDRKHNQFSKKERRKVRSKFFPDMKPHIFDRVTASIPYVFMDYFKKL